MSPDVTVTVFWVSSGCDSDVEVWACTPTASYACQREILTCALLPSRLILKEASKGTAIRPNSRTSQLARSYSRDSQTTSQYLPGVKQLLAARGIRLADMTFGEVVVVVRANDV